MCKVSVIVPVYNAERFIGRCVKSIISQTFQDYELLLVDDGSHDSSLRICQEFADKDTRIKVFHKENGGASSTRKYGVEHADGIFVTFVDADDCIPDNALEDLLRAVDSYDLDIAQGERRFISLDPKKETITGFTKEEICDSKTYVNYLFRGYSNCGPWASLFRRTLFDKNTFDLASRVDINEDFYMNLCLALNAQKIGLIKSVVYNYLENEDSVTHNYSFTSILPQKHLYGQIKKVLVEHHCFDTFSKQYYSRLINSISSACFHNKGLLTDPYVQEIAKESQQFTGSISDKALCVMLLNPWLFFVFAMANKIRQFLFGYRIY